MLRKCRLLNTGQATGEIDTLYCDMLRQQHKPEMKNAGTFFCKLFISEYIFEADKTNQTILMRITLWLTTTTNLFIHNGLIIILC